MKCLVSFGILFLCFPIVQAETKPLSVVINGIPATVTASSEQVSKTPGAYSVKNLFDGDSTTAWVEGAKGDGSGEWIQINFSKNVIIKNLKIETGYQIQQNFYRK